MAIERLLPLCIFSPIISSLLAKFHYSIPLSHCSTFPLFLCSSAPLPRCSSVPLFLCSSVPLPRCSSVPPFLRSSVPPFLRSIIIIAKMKLIKINQIHFILIYLYFVCEPPQVHGFPLRVKYP
ncbi:hypothetical protein Sant_1520 [Sodalis praecaptivus]|uniref:Uncharacterized protein n=1 Tax=Sodalis praecaptivus TaxID=1239307 RepID=W0HWQ6_9GAMM|nr:hypothetical protein Sant_1520 [Sodalis praecaptivus]